MLREKKTFAPRLTIAAGLAALMMSAGSASAVVVLSDGFGDGDRNNDGMFDRFDYDINADFDEVTPLNDAPNSYEPPNFLGTTVNEITGPENALDTGITWTSTRGWTSSVDPITNRADASAHIAIIDDSAGLSPDGVSIDSGYALSANSKGRGASFAGFFGQNVALGANDGDQVKVSFDFRLWGSSPNANPDLAGGDIADLRWGLFQDTDNQLGQTNPFAGQPGTQGFGPGVWGQDDGAFRGDFGAIGANGDAGWYTRIKMLADAPADGSDDLVSGTGPRIYEESNIDPGGEPNNKKIMEGGDNDNVASPDDLNPQFTSLLVGKVYNLSLTLERATDTVQGDTILATYTVENISDGTTFSFSGTESLTDNTGLPGSGGIQSDSWDYFAMRNSSANSFNEEDYDWIIDNFLLETFEAGGLVGDLDGDGFVGINDLNIVLGNWNQNVPPANPLADPSGDGFVGIDDLNAVLGNWNAGTPPNAGANVPEPASMALLSVGALASLKRRR